MKHEGDIKIILLFYIIVSRNKKKIERLGIVLLEKITKNTLLMFPEDHNFNVINFASVTWHDSVAYIY